MNTEILKSLLAFGGGLGMFIYGMQLMADGLQKSAGAKTRNLLAILTNNRIVGVLVGALITAIIQSSSATTVMVVGFVNAGLMNLSQAIGVIMGANIGTTMTGWLVSMSEWGSFFKPDFFAPLLLVAGTAIMLFSKTERTRQFSSILVGFGILFIGLNTMSGAIAPYSDEPIFYQAFTVIGSNPLFGLLVGAVVTAVIQSSSASMGILQTLAFNGVVNWGSAAFIALGQNIGTCVTALISCIGAHRNAQRAAMLHLLFNIIGSILVGTAVWIFFMINPAISHATVSGTSLALFHTGFNIATTVLLFPFANVLVKMSERLIPDHGEMVEKKYMHLDKRMLMGPSFAFDAIRQEIIHMGTLALENISFSRDVLVNPDHFAKMEENEQKIDEYQKELASYLEKFDASTLPPREQVEMQHAMLMINHIERISDYCMNIRDSAKDMLDEKMSEYTIEDINTISSQAYKTMKYALKMRESYDIDHYEKVEKHENRVDEMGSRMRETYIDRLNSGKYNVREGIYFLDTIYNYERISDHASKLAEYTLQEA